METFDRIDVRIMAALQENGRLTNVELSQRVGLSETPCLRRVRRLEQEGVIARYAAVLDPRRIGLGVTAFLQVKIERHRDEDTVAFREAVLADPEVVACWLVTGTADFLLQVVSRDMDAYGDFVVHRVLKMPGVKDVSSSFALQVVKPSSALPLGHLDG